MKRMLCLLTALLLLGSALPALGEAAEPTVAQELTAQGITVQRYSLSTETDSLKQTVDYPVFECENPVLTQYLEQTLTAPLLALRKLDKQATPDAYQNGAKDAVRGGFLVSLEVDGLLSLEATVGNRPAGQESYETTFFYRLIDLAAMRELTLYELFAEEQTQVDEAVAQAVYAQAKAEGVLLSSITSVQQVPSPNSYYLAADYLRCIYDEGVIAETFCDLDIPWSALGLTKAGLLAGVTAAPTDDAPATPAPTDTPMPTPAPTDTVPPVEAIVTPTPIPLAIGDAAIQEVLCSGLWRPLQGDGSTYYQFTADGKLLVVNVMEYSLADGVLASEALSGSVTAGGTAWTLTAADGGNTGFVLNRAARAVQPEELVTPSPTPVPTDTPAPTDTPTPSPTPSPTPAPDPLLTASIPTLSLWSDAAFDKEKVLKVYSGPGVDYYRSSGAQVATNKEVSVYGVEGDWVLVSYKITSNRRSRIGYVENSTLADAATAPQLALGSAKAKLARKTNATDDPLDAKGTLCELAAETQVTLLAFLGEDWVYIETTNKDKPCRLFVPRSAFYAE